MRRGIVVFVSLLALTGTPALAAPIFAGFPAPGGTTFGSVGNAGFTGGALRTYTGFNTSMFDDLYFGFTGVLGPDSTASSGVSQPFFVSSATATEIIWTGGLWDIFRISAPTVSVPVRFRTYFTDIAGTTNITNLVVPSGTVGIGGTPYVLPMDAASLATWGGGFKLFAAFEAFDGTNWVGVNNFFNSLSNTMPCSNCVPTSTTGAFWYTEPTVAPEPASLALFGLVSLGAAHRLRRRKDAIG